MKKIMLIIISILAILAVAIVVLYLNSDEYRIKTAFDARVVKKIPIGFVHLPREEDAWGNGMRYVPFESYIFFVDADGNNIYQTSYRNSDFIVKYNNEYYVNEAKILELIDIVNASTKKDE